MKCVIVDDEPLARQLLESYLNKIDELSLIKSCGNAMEAMDVLQEESVDLLFLDIDMPNISGIELLKSMQTRPRVVLTTAHREYAMQAYDLDVIDYLLKPITFERFLRGIAKMKQLKKYEPQAEANSTASYDDAFIYLKENRERVKILLKDILFIESLRDYVRVRTLTKEVITHQKISYLEQKLPQAKFIRVHRSYIAAVDHIVSFTNDSIKVSESNVPIGRNYRATVMSRLKDQQLLTP